MESLNKRQEYIKEYIKNKKETQIRDILVYIKNDFNVDRRTVIRDIDTLLRLGYVSKQGAGRSTSYSISNRYDLLKEIDVEKYFSIPFNEREIKTNFNFDIFDILKESVFSEDEEKKLAQLHSGFVKNFSQYDSQTLINKEFERILIEFSWKSSQIEGNTYSLLNTEQLIKNNKLDRKKTKKETQMILNHKDAFNESLQNKNVFVRLSRANIEHIHYLLTKDLDIPRNLRKSLVRITGTNYKPLDNIYQIEEALQMMIKLINNKENFFEKAFLSLVLLSYIQAFEDGNKRTARMTANAILLSYNSIPISYRAVNEIEYKKASLLFYEVNNLFHFKDIFLKQFEFAVENYFK
ncbi:MAG: Fic family protein [Candidatus Pacebacteria bacterium]|nr:Fic family protein [Candidatus Paceibacterota bacterium]